MARPEKIIIEIEMKHADLEYDFDMAIVDILEKATRKIFEQCERPESLCQHPEDADILRDINGNRMLIDRGLWLDKIDWMKVRLPRLQDRARAREGRVERRRGRRALRGLRHLPGGRRP